MIYVLVIVVCGWSDCHREEIAFFPDKISCQEALEDAKKNRSDAYCGIKPK